MNVCGSVYENGWVVNGMCAMAAANLISGDFTGIEGQSGKIMCQGGKPDTGKFHSSYIGMSVCGSAYENGCVVDGMCVVNGISGLS